MSATADFREKLAFKAYEIEELADRWFFRPSGALIAHAAYPTPLTPNHLTLLGTLIGVAASLQMLHPGRAWWVFAGLVLHSVFDSSDGQLARLRGRMTIEGRILDGLSGYAVFLVFYLSLGFGYVAAGGSRLIFVLVVLAGLSHMFQASMYDYYRTQYIDYGIKKRLPVLEKPDPSSGLGRLLSFAYGDYDGMQRRLAPFHARLGRTLQGLFPGGGLSDEAAAAYRRRNFWMVRGWNIFGDNTRFYTVALCAAVGRNELFLYMDLFVLNFVFLILATIQSRQDGRLLEELGAAAGGLHALEK